MTDNNGAGVLTGEQVMALGRRTISLPSGGKVVIGKIAIDELAEIIGAMPDVSALAVTDERQAAKALLKKPEAKAVLKSMGAVLIAGMLEPELHFSHKDGATPRDFDLDDQLEIFTAILDFSNYTKREGAKVLPLSRTAP